jgi:uncharacterized protein (TIGR02996 family)
MGKKKQQPSAPVSLRESLEAALVEDPDDLAAHSGYADYLAEQGDPWGELIQVQLALEDESTSADERETLRQREKQLLAAHAPTQLGELAPFVLREPSDDTWPTHQYIHRWRRGWLDALHIGKITVNHARALVRSPQTRLLRELVVVYAAGEGEQGEDEEAAYEPGDDLPGDRVQFLSLHPLVRSPHLVNVRRFHLGNVETVADYRQWEGSYTLGHAAVDLILKMPRIEEISLWTRGVKMEQLFTASLSKLRQLQIHHMNRDHPLEKLAANPALSNLTHLMFHPHFLEWEQDGAYIRREAVAALIHARHLKSLKHLQLRLSDLGDEGIYDIIASGILKRLKVLDLRHGCITDEGARALAACPDTRRLRLLDLNRNRLTAPGIEALKGLGIEARVEDQWGLGHDGHAESYLQEGDFE